MQSRFESGSAATRVLFAGNGTRVIQNVAERRKYIYMLSGLRGREGRGERVYS